MAMRRCMHDLLALDTISTSYNSKTRSKLRKLPQLYSGLTGCQASRQAAQCPGFTSRRSGTTCRQRSTAMGQRGWNTQPGGGFRGLGTSPRSTTRSRRASTSGSGIGTAAAGPAVEAGLLEFGVRVWFRHPRLR